MAIEGYSCLCDCHSSLYVRVMGARSLCSVHHTAVHITKSISSVLAGSEIVCLNHPQCLELVSAVHSLSCVNVPCLAHTLNLAVCRGWGGGGSESRCSSFWKISIRQLPAGRKSEVPWIKQKERDK